DRDADFSAFYGRERQGIARALAVTLSDAQLGAEAADEAMARAYARWRSVASYDNPAAWVYRVGHNWALSQLRRRRFRADQPVPDRSLKDPEPTDAALWSAVAALPPQQRAVVVLRFGLDWPLPRIAIAVDAPVGTVKSRLSRAVNALRQRLEVDA
ncbi:MAG: RNA polymerase sigma factor, partial [Nitriliruptorales bacterium]|nr:RNA polymerase sigma factor [Nitriliruptorales bacterium]